MTQETESEVEDARRSLGLLLRAALVLARQGEPLDALVGDVCRLTVESAACVPESLWAVACGLRQVVCGASDRSPWEVEADLKDLSVRFRAFSSLESTISV